MTTLKELQEKGAFVKAGAEKKSIVWKHKVDGEAQEDTFDVFIKNLSAGDAEKLFSGMTDEKSRSAVAISELICADSKGTKPLLTYEQAYQLAPSLSALLVNTINEVRSPKN